MIRKHRRFLLLLALFIAGVLIHQFTLPLFEGSDELEHYNYVEYLRTDQTLPDRDLHLENTTRQESGQPPLTYWLGAQVLNALNLKSPGDEYLFDYAQTVRNRWNKPVNPWLNRNDNLNYYFHGAAFTSPDVSNVFAVNRVLRMTSLVFAVVAVIGAYGAAREIFKRESWTLTATAFYAFLPTMLHGSSYFNNDMTAIAFGSLATWETLRLLRLGASPGRVLLIGLLLALGGLSKVNAFLIAPGVGIALLIDWRKRRLPFWRLIVNGLLLALPIVILFAPWVWYGITEFNDPVGTRTHRTPGYFHDPLLTLPEVVPLLPNTYLSYLARFGITIYMQPASYVVLSAVITLALVGWVLLSVRARRVTERTANPSPLQNNIVSNLTLQQALVLGVMALTVFAGLVRFMQEIFFIPGRLLYPAQIAFAAFFTGGLYLLARRFPRLDRPLRTFAVTVVGVAGVILAPVAIYDAFRPPTPLTRDQLSPLQGSAFDYDQTIRFLGQTQENPRLNADWHRVTLCWEVLKTPERAAAFSLKFVRDGVIVAERVSVHGLGHYDSSLWKPGDIFCDPVDVPVDVREFHLKNSPQPGQIYDMLLVLLDTKTLEVDWQVTTPEGNTVEFPFVGQIISPAGDISAQIEGDLTTTTITFPNFANLSYALQGDLAPGETIQLDLLWDVTGTTPDNWSQFIHLVSADESLVLADGEPRGNQYPTWAWAAGEKVADRWTLSLPEDLPPGEYTLKTGFYRRDTGERMTVTQDGLPVPDNAAIVVQFTVNAADKSP
jgi:4-amino-4-deoxy-L-arabinose transferase-like glycosyltransferase